MTVAAAEVEQSRGELRDHVDNLCSIAHHVIERDDGERDFATTPSLIEQVENEIVQQSAVAGAFTPRSKPPAWVDAIQFLGDLDRETGHCKGDTRIDRVRAWSAWMSSEGTPGMVVDACGLAAAWEQAAKHLIDPQPKMQLRGQKCPQCGAERVWDRFDRGAGESHARPALQIDSDRGVCECLACRASWPPHRWLLLAEVLEQQRRERESS